MTVSSDSSSQTSQLRQLASWMAGDFSNRRQSDAAPSRFAHIRIFFRPLPPGFFSGIGFYSEQAYDYDLWRPYRQGIHQLIDRGDHIYIENYGLQDALMYAGAGHNQSILRSIPSDRTVRRDGCAMVFRREGSKFIGSVEPGNACLIPRDGRLTYLTSHVEITETTWMSLDQGMDVNSHERVWGSTEGHLQFEKQASYASELPD
ncbi:MAG: chorismate-binding protein [Leptolyngbya sp. SIO4C1]|nr:chorismate-binding protein [Leptolyngbya sp. SIO4C1]